MSLALALAATSGCRDRPESAPPPPAEQPPPPAARAHLQGLSGEVTVKRAAGDEWLPAAEGMALFPNDKVATAARARAQLQFAGSGGTLTLQENALVSLTEARTRPGRPPPDVTVLQGRVDAELAHPDKQTLSVDTPSVTVRAGREVVFQ
jgi:hypothetical protein